MTRPNVCLGLALAFGLLAVPASADDDDGEREPPRITRILDVADLQPMTHPQLRRNLWGRLMFRVRPSNESPEEVLSEAEEHGVAENFSADSVAESIYGVAAEVDDEFQTRVEGTQIVLHGTNEAVQRAADATEILRRIAGNPVHIEVDELLLAPDVRVPATLDDAALARLGEADLRGGTRRLSLNLDAGCWRFAEAVSGTRRVVDADVEIAEDAAIADPVVTRVEEGLRVMACGSPLSDGSVLVRVLAATGSLNDEPRRLALGEDELGEVDLPDIDAGFVWTELLLAAGRPQVVVLARPEAEQRVLVFRLDAAPMERIGGTFRAVPMGAFREVAPALQLRMSDDPTRDEGMSLWLQEKEDGHRLSREFAHNEVDQVMERDFDEDRAMGEFKEWLLGGAYLLRGPEESLDRAAARVAEIEKDVFRTAHLSVRFEQRGRGGEAHVLGRVSAPVAIGLPTCLAAYRQVAFVADYDVEVAQKSQISDPRIGAALAGLLVNVRVAEAGHGAHMVTAELRVSEIGSPQGRGFGATDVGAMEMVKEVARYAEARVRTTSARPAEIHMGASPFDEGARLVAVITVE